MVRPMAAGRGRSAGVRGRGGGCLANNKAVGKHSAGLCTPCNPPYLSASSHLPFQYPLKCATCTPSGGRDEAVLGKRDEQRDTQARAESSVDRSARRAVCSRSVSTYPVGNHGHQGQKAHNAQGAVGGAQQVLPSLKDPGGTRGREGGGRRSTGGGTGVRVCVCVCGGGGGT
jgi:hypothetical protein